MLEDKLLIFRLKRGDEQALRQIYEKYKDTLLTVATSLLQDTSEAEDVLYDIFVSFTKSIQKFHLYGSLKNYLISCLVNRARDIHRKRMYQVVGLDSTGPIRPDSAEPTEAVIDDEEAQLLTEALAQLPAQQQEVIILHLQGGMKFREIADMQEVSINTIQGRYRYGLDKLRSILDGKLIE